MELLKSFFPKAQISRTGKYENVKVTLPVVAASVKIVNRFMVPDRSPGPISYQRTGQDNEHVEGRSKVVSTISN